MSWESFYLVCFFVGLILSALSFLSGALHLHLPARLHLPHGLSQGLHRVGGVVKAGATRQASDVPFFNMSSMMAFLCWFGGMGYILTHYGKMWAWFAFSISVLFGLGGAAIVFWFLVKVLLGHEQPLNDEDFEMVGVVGVVTSRIRSGGTGEMIFLQQGTRRAAAARSQEGAAIAKGAEIVVTRYEKGIAYVKPWNEFAEENRMNVSGSTERVH